MRIMIVEDDALARLTLKERLEKAAQKDKRTDVIDAFPSIGEAEKYIAQNIVDVAFLDLNLSPSGTDFSGIELLKKIRAAFPNTVCIVMTGVEDSGVIEKCLKLGADDYLIKPVEGYHYQAILTKALIRHRLYKRNQTLKAQAGELAIEPITLSTKSSAFQGVIDEAKQLAGTNLSILITGETGVGKEIMAQYIWSLENDQSRPFIPVNCGAISEHLVESTLFGHKRGAFTGASEDRAGMFEAADGGDIFLDEVGTMPSHVQVSLLRTLNSGEVTRVGQTKGKKFSFRVIAATNEKLVPLLEKGSFREDLIYRLKEVELKIPPLRDRKEDISDLIELFLKKSGHANKHLDRNALQLCLNYTWPGNVRQLEKVIRVAAELSDNPEITENCIKRQFLEVKDTQKTSVSSNFLFNISESDLAGQFGCTIQNAEKAAIEYALNKSNGSVSEAARWLGIPRTNLRRKIAEFQIIS